MLSSGVVGDGLKLLPDLYFIFLLLYIYGHQKKLSFFCNTYCTNQHYICHQIYSQNHRKKQTKDIFIQVQ